MAVTRSNNFNGGSNGVQINTTDTGSGDPWDAVVNAAGQTIAWDNTHVHSGTESMMLVTSATPDNSEAQWNGFGSLAVDVWMRCYLYLPAQPSNLLAAMSARNDVGSLSAVCGVRGASGVVCIEDSAFNFQLLGSVVIALNQWTRLEWRIRPGAGTAQFEWWLYNNAESTVADEHMSGSTFTSLANTDAAWFGMADNPGPVSYTFWQDDVAVSTSGKIGPLFESPLELSGLSQAVNRAASF